MANYSNMSTYELEQLYSRKMDALAECEDDDKCEAISDELDEIQDELDTRDPLED